LNAEKGGEKYNQKTKIDKGLQPRMGHQRWEVLSKTCGGAGKKEMVG